MTLGEKIRQRREELKLSQKQVADRVSIRQQSYEAIEAGRTQRSKFLPRIAQLLGLPMSELDPEITPSPETAAQQGRPLISPERDFPVYSAAEGGAGEIIRSSDPVDWVPRPEPVARVKDAYGLYIVGESMAPEFEPGDIALVNPALPLVGNTTCILYAEREGEARAMVKRLLRATPKEWQLRQWNPKKDFSLSRKEWGICHRVLGKYSRQ